MQDWKTAAEAADGNNLSLAGWIRRVWVRGASECCGSLKWTEFSFCDSTLTSSSRRLTQPPNGDFRHRYNGSIRKRDILGCLNGDCKEENTQGFAIGSMWEKMWSLCCKEVRKLSQRYRRWINIKSLFKFVVLTSTNKGVKSFTSSFKHQRHHSWVSF